MNTVNMVVLRTVAYAMKIDLLSNATVVEKAVQFVERHREMTHQNEEVAIDNDGSQNLSRILDKLRPEVG